MEERFMLSEKEYARWLTFRDEEASDFVHIWAHLRPDVIRVDLGFDDDGYYRYNDHPLWLYFKNSYDTDSNDWLPMCVCGSPYIPLPESRYQLNIADADFEAVKEFTRRYGRLLKRVADGESSVLVFDAINNQSQHL